MHDAKAAWYAPFAWGWFAMGALLAVWAHAAAALGTFGVIRVLDFDYMLRLAEVVYTARGLTPYVDFGFVYPPGQVWLYGKLLGLQDPAQVNIAIDLVNLVLWSICAWQVMRLTKGLRWWLGGAVLLILGGAMPLVWGAGSWVLLEPFPLLVIAALLLVEVMERGPSRAKLAALVVAAAAGTLFRWDWILATAGLEAGWAAAMWLAAGALKREQSNLVRCLAVRLWKAALCALAGVALAVAAIAAYASATGAWAAARMFMFYVPVYILPFRRLPVPMGFHSSRQWLEAVIGMSLIAVAALVDYLRSRDKAAAVYLLKGVALLAPCIALLPYAFGRADETHLLPLTMLVVVTSIVGFAFWPNKGARWLLLMAMVMNAEPSLHTAIPAITTDSVQRADIQLERIHKLTARCTELFPHDARSIFVGQLSYHRFIVNAPVFYVLRADLRPATPFISDEPGLQNSCAFGSRIAADLLRAPRPLILALDTGPWDPEPNLTRSMTSCGKIEAAIAAMPTTIVGTCRVADDYIEDDSRTFQVMVVR